MRYITNFVFNPDDGSVNFAFLLWFAVLQAASQRTITGLSSALFSAREEYQKAVTRRKEKEKLTAEVALSTTKPSLHFTPQLFLLCLCMNVTRRVDA